MSPYHLEIVKYSGCDPADVGCVEQVMRDAHHGILGELPRAQFKREAKKAREYVEALRTIARDPDTYLRELGMTREQLDRLIQRTLTEPRMVAP